MQLHALLGQAAGDVGQPVGGGFEDGPGYGPGARLQPQPQDLRPQPLFPPGGPLPLQEGQHHHPAGPRFDRCGLLDQVGDGPSGDPRPPVHDGAVGSDRPPHDVDAGYVAGQSELGAPAPFTHPDRHPQASGPAARIETLARRVDGGRPGGHGGVVVTGRQRDSGRDSVFSRGNPGVGSHRERVTETVQRRRLRPYAVEGGVTAQPRYQKIPHEPGEHPGAVPLLEQGGMRQMLPGGAFGGARGMAEGQRPLPGRRHGGGALAADPQRYGGAAVEAVEGVAQPFQPDGGVGLAYWEAGRAVTGPGSGDHLSSAVDGNGPGGAAADIDPGDYLHAGHSSLQRDARRGPCRASVRRGLHRRRFPRTPGRSARK